MSKYWDDLCTTFDGKKIGDLKELTKQIQADKNISKALKQRMEREKRSKINQEISKLLEGR